MKTLILLLMVLAFVAPNRSFAFSNTPEEPIGGKGGVLYLGACLYGNQKVHSTNDGSAYHFSWCYDGGQKYDWRDANNYCNNLGRGWYSVSIETAEENYFITSIIESHRLPYIWTGGHLVSQRGNYAQRQTVDVWTWIGTGRPLTFTNWGRTGRLGIPQPDNVDNRNERCLGILNHHFEGDGTTWHDLACHLNKAVICERQGSSSSYYG